MKNHIRTNALRTIKKSFGCFCSLIIMSLLGVLVYVGLEATSPDMLNSLDKYLDEHDTYDIKIISTMGLTDEDIESLKNVEGVLKSEGFKNVDVLITVNEVDTVINVSSLPSDINKLDIISGRLPEKEDEIVVEDNYLKKLNKKIGDKIILEDENLINHEFTIVGSVRSSLYFSNTKVNQNRGTTTIGSGTINYYSYILKSNFKQEYYTNIYLMVDGAKELTTSKDEYIEKIEDTLDKIEKIKNEQEDERYQGIYKEALEEILDNEKEVNEELSKAKKSLDNSKKQLNEFKVTLNNVKKNLDSSKVQLDNGKKELDEAELQLKNILNQYNITDIDKAIQEVDEGINAISTQIKLLDSNSIEYQELNKQLIELISKKEMLSGLRDNRNNLSNSRNTYNINLNNYNNGYKQYQSNLATYNSNLKKYNNGLKEYNENKEKAEKEIRDAKEELGKIEHPKWFIYDRSDDQTYASYINQTDSIKSLATLFPVVFYAVAILVSLVSMNRMVEDDRSEIGTLKSLGFSNNDIRKKYIIFSLTATLVGATIGVAIGLSGIPYLIFTIYRLLFDVPVFVLGFNTFSTLFGVLIAIICICGASIITANRILKDKPAILMRPKAPKSGKKILLERVKFIWNRLKFSNKVTVRNLFRYKKRVAVTIFGIAGCTALMLCGFGIKDSIVDITNMQYIKTFKYEVTAYSNEISKEELDSLIEQIDIKDYTEAEIITGTYEDSNVSMLVFNENADMEKIAYIENTDGKEITLVDDGVIITDKLAKIYNIKVDDYITILDSEQNEYEVRVAEIAKNYMGHYVYMNRDMLEKIGYEYKNNVIYMNTEEKTEEEKDEISNVMLSNDKILSVVHTTTLVDSVQDMLNSLDKVIVVLVSLSAMLSFVVLYNLSNINIRERKREIATLKVLGFYDKEVDNYITKEMIILTILGIGFGLVFGYFLTNMVVSTVEMENAHFIRHIKLNSYIYASLISILFTLIVNFVTHFTLKRIDMIESLKSVE